MAEFVPLSQAVLLQGIRSRAAPQINGLNMHILEAGFEEQNRPCILLLHGFLRACARLLGCHLLDGAGHWTPPEPPEEGSALLIEFARRAHALRTREI